MRINPFFAKFNKKHAYGNLTLRVHYVTIVLHRNNTLNDKVILLQLNVQSSTK